MMIHDNDDDNDDDDDDNIFYILCGRPSRLNGIVSQVINHA